MVIVKVVLSECVFAAVHHVRRAVARLPPRCAVRFLWTTIFIEKQKALKDMHCCELVKFCFSLDSVAKNT